MGGLTITLIRRLCLVLIVCFLFAASGASHAAVSPSGTTIPPASQIVDGSGNVWTLQQTYAVENGVVLTDGNNFTLLLYYNGGIYAKASWGQWYSFTPQNWVDIAGDPRSTAAIQSTFFGMTMNAPITGTWPTVSVGSLGKGECINWEYVEPSRGSFNWGNLDAEVALAASHGVDLFYANDGVPAWAVTNHSSCAPNSCSGGANICAQIPDSLTDLDNFYTALATRYCGTALKYIELWNEPWAVNAAPGFVIPPSDMATMTQHIYADIRAACPSMRIGLADLNGSATYAYDSALLAAGEPTGVDFVTLHAYPDPSGSASVDAPEGIYAPDDRYLWPFEDQTLVNTYLPGKPIWMTEGSWNLNTGVGAYNDATRAAFVSRWFVLQASNGFGRSYWYSWDSPTWGTLDPSLNPPGDSVPATAYQQTYNWLVGRTMAVNACQHGSGPVWTCSLTGSDGYTGLIVWNTAGNNSYTPPSPSLYTQYRDLSGNVTPYSGGAVTVGIKPILFEN